ncbi:MAG: polysaccharide pyruvyl transferase [Candidatus Peregrinibacteria bacterium GW2011_GWC2_39_14]|nr:MAG: Pyruvyl-transferase [Candidatus Peregrinibacteria bacterium GW2011_GWA2_38_36]KKR05152.1 MAG: polysaccharide pyruvyl transferase [Candidatus Peregrinibacteria bacterium GW2011_GWC2_39_14]
MKIIICGNYGATNIGDELILKGILKYIDLKKHEVRVLSADPKSTKLMHGVRSLRLMPAGPKSLIKGILKLSLLRTLSGIKNCDLFIFGGGGLFDDSYPRAAIIWGIQALTAYVCKKPVFIMAQSFGPLKAPLTKIITRAVCNYAKCITVRDENSKLELEKLGIDKAKTKVKVTADPAFYLDEKNLLKNPRENKVQKIKHKYVLAVLRQGLSKMQIKALSDTFDKIHAKYGLHVAFLPFHNVNPDDSLAFAPFLNKKFVQRLNYTDDSAHIYKLIVGSEAVIGMRLHSLILSILAGKPFLALSSFDKVKGVLSHAGLSESFIDLKGLTAEKLCKKYDNLVKNKFSNMTKISKAKANLSQKSALNKILLTKFM